MIGNLLNLLSHSSCASCDQSCARLNVAALLQTKPSWEDQALVRPWRSTALGGAPGAPVRGAKMGDLSIDILEILTINYCIYLEIPLEILTINYSNYRDLVELNWDLMENL